MWKIIEGKEKYFDKFIASWVKIAAPSEDEIPNLSYPIHGLWDTGSMWCAISTKLADKMGLQTLGVRDVRHGGGTTSSPYYLIDLHLSDELSFHNIEAFGNPNLDENEMLIGMNVISHGDFCVMGNFGERKFSFVVPTLEGMDFADMAKKMNDVMQK